MPHYYDEQPGELQPFRITVRARKKELPFWSSSGVFSKDKIDLGTKLLVERCVLEDGWSVHDLGCGYGVVGVLLKMDYPNCSVMCSDVNQHAIALTRKNSREHNAEVHAVKSDGYKKIDEEFDTVLLNPPYVAGRKVVFQLIEEAFQHVKPGGLLQVVARHQKGGKKIMEKMLELAGNCDDSRKKSGFRIYVSRREPNS